MEQVVSTGGGQKAKVKGYRIGGKTGTAQKINTDAVGYKEGSYIASFCGFAPVVQNATGTVLTGPFMQDDLVNMLSGMLPRLDELKQQTLAYAEKEDFSSRARVFADILEKC